MLRRTFGLLLCILFMMAPMKAAEIRKVVAKVRITDTTGDGRSQWPVEVNIPVSQHQRSAGQNLLVLGESFDGENSSVAYQVTDSSPFSFRIAFPASVPAHGTSVYDVCLSNNVPKVLPSPLIYTAQTEGSLGVTINTGRATFVMASESGQLESFSTFPEGKDHLVFRQAKLHPVHYDPDVYSPYSPPWGHASDWNSPILFDPAKHNPFTLPENTKRNVFPYYYSQVRGPYLFRTARWGNMPRNKDVEAGVTYTIVAGMPVIFGASIMETKKQLTLTALRNGELVFSRHQFDTAFWIDDKEQAHTTPCYDYDDPDRGFANIATLPNSIPVLGFSNERKGFGVAYVNISFSAINKFSGDSMTELAHFYIRDYNSHGEGSPMNFTYLVRPIVYRDNFTNHAVPAGAVYMENFAIVVFQLKEKGERYDEIIRWQRLIRTPPRIEVEPSR